MPNHEPENESSAFHEEAGAVIFDKPKSQEEVARQRLEDEQHKFARSQIKTNRAMAWFTGALVLATFCTIVVGIWQANISQEASRAAKSAADTASQTLNEMKSGQGANDTHTLAQQAVTQSAQTTSLATAAKEANSIARKASVSVQRAFIVVDHLDILAKRTPSGDVGTWIVNPVVSNSGETPTRNMHLMIDFDARDVTPLGKEPPTDPSNFPSLSEIRSHIGWQRGIVGPHASVSNFTVLNGFGGSDLNRKDGFTLTGHFVYGVFIYGDVFDERPLHITEFCFTLYRTGIVGDQFLPYGRCAHHNCADQECEKE